MATIPETQNGSKLGLRQIRAQQLKEQDERRQRDMAAIAARANQARAAAGDPAAESPDVAGDDQQYQGTGPVGTGEYVVKQGECTSSIAKDHGHFWETIWNDSANTELREVRQNPNVLLPDDRVHVPPPRRKEEPGETEMRHRFVRRGEPARLRIQLRDRWGNPFALRDYRLRIDDRDEIEGKTDSEGRIDRDIPAAAATALLTVKLGQDSGDSAHDYCWKLNLGHLDPHDSVSGVQGRLCNLGFLPGAPTGDLNDATREALKIFQARNSLPVTGQPDAQTCEKLRQYHAGETGEHIH